MTLELTLGIVDQMMEIALGNLVQAKWVGPRLMQEVEARRLAEGFAAEEELADEGEFAAGDRFAVGGVAGGMAEGVAEGPVEGFAEKWLKDLSGNGTEIVFELQFVALGVDVFGEAEVEVEVEVEVGIGSFLMKREKDDDDDIAAAAAAGCY